jgi:hypothetical protein
MEQDPKEWVRELAEDLGLVAEDCAKCFAEETGADSLLGQENRKTNKLPSAQKQKNENKNYAS